MASKSLGTLTLDLIAKIGAFTGPLDKASQEAKKRNAEIAKSFDNLAKGVGVAIGAIPAVLTAMVVSSANVAKEISNQAALAGLGTTEFQKYAAGARSVGVEQDKLSDILKDVNDKVGDFLSTGGGELQDFFTNIAPKVGVTADQFKKLNSKEALALYVTSLEKANVNQQEMTFYMEAIANDSTALVPLLRNNGKAFDELGQAALDAGVVMDESTIAAAKQFGTELSGLGKYLTSAKTMLAAEFLPVLAQFSKDVNQSAKDAGGLKGQVGELGEKMVTATAFVVNAGDGVARVFKIVANTLVGTFSTAVGYIQKLDSSANAALSQLSFGDTSKEFAANANQMAAAAELSFGIAREAAEDNRKELETPLSGDRFKEYVANAKKAAAELAKTTQTTTPGTGSNVDPAAAKKAASDAAAAAKKIQDSFDSTETDLKRQIELINTTTDARKNATEVTKLQFEFESGKLAGLNDQQKERLKGLAEELDKRTKLQQANKDDKDVREFQYSVDQQLTIDQRGLDSTFLNAYDTDEVKRRVLEMLAIEQDYQDQLELLRQRHEGGDVSDSVFERETEALRKALDDRKKMQEDYYLKVDDLQKNGAAGFISGFATQAQASMDLYGNMKAVGADTFSNLTDAMTEWAETGKLDAKGLAASFIQSVGHALLSYAAAQVAMAGLSAFTAMIGIPFVGPVVAPGAAIAATAAAGVMMTAVGSALDGQAHDGIDFVPADGTWNLKRGERVTTAETSAKLDRTLDRVSRDSGGGGSGKAPVVNLIEDSSRAGQSSSRMQDSQWVIDVVVSNIMGEGEIHDANSSKYGLRSQGA
ncbi:phage tail tape measure C-terminal domain-containing protein [Pseudomonas sp. R5(2019)]|uniref:phage tail tape measure C-terminal domain-containing protein n=1 Tax=Pseudomonas sp. R5(2019) TaxID=2697566 RepID=UPI00141221A4|nr:phage tail tape measure C-terminal domain-containing protein [Pseudomonas sp. R5(2019)]NBA95503.1 tail tape measure protein [Pseudomonas sp. R5(2019)]